MNWSSLLEWFHKAPLYAFAAALVLGLLLFAGDDVLAKAGLQEHRHWISVVFLVAVVVVLARAMHGLWLFISRRVHEWRSDQEAFGKLLVLSSEQKQILRGYIEDQASVRSQYVQSMAVRQLVDDGIIRQAGLVKRSHIHDSQNQAPFEIQRWAFDYLSAHYGLLLGDVASEDQASQE